MRDDAPVPRDTRLQLVADGTLIRPLLADGTTYSFVISRDVRVVSLQAPLSIQPDVPSLHQAEPRGREIAVAEIVIRSKAGDMVISADDPRLSRGWHAPEREGVAISRRTAGLAEIPWSDVSGPAVVTVRCSTLNPPWSPEELTLADFAASSADSLDLHWDGVAGPQSFVSLAVPEPPPSVVRNGLHVQWCLGMYSSGSTWVFNAIRSVMNVLLPDELPLGIYAETADQLPPDWTGSDQIIIKSHHTDEAATAIVLQHADRIWISIRDPRDCVASASTYIFPDFDSALEAVVRSALHCERFILDPRSVLLRYEDGFIDDPATLDRFATVHSRVLSTQDREQLFQQTRRTAIETMIKQFDSSETVDDGYLGHRVHLETQWHTHHLNRTGEVGRWRRALSPTQAMEIQRRLGPWMERFGYGS